MLIALLISFIVLGHLAGFFSGYSKSICDLSEEGKLNKKPEEYWIKHKSYNNKNNYTGKIKIWLMRNLFVAFTDGWHKYQLFLTVGLILSGYFIGYVSGGFNPYYTFLLLSIYGVRTLTFHFFYNSKHLKK